MNTLETALQKVPPQSLEAEQAVLGAILIENQAINRALEILAPADFYREGHRTIFEAMIRLQDRGEAIDLVTLSEELRQSGELERIGGSGYLANLVNQVATSASIRHHARIIREKALLRHLISVATEIVTTGLEGGEKVEDLLDRAEQSIFRISERKIRPSFLPVKDVVKVSFETIERLYETKERITGIPTGFRDLDNLTAGLQPSDLIIIAGRPSMGKTAFALGIARFVGLEKRKPVAIFSLEMSAQQLVIRMLCAEARVDAHKVRSGYLGRADWPRLTDAASRLTEAPIFIDDSGALSVLEMRAKARRLMAEHGLALVIVDYLQLMRGHGDADRREQEIAEITRSLKGLAKELNLPVIALSQLSRAVEGRQDRRPVLADLRESGAIEQDADLVMFLYREEMYHPTTEHKGVAEVIVRKQRNGPLDTVNLKFFDRYTRFDDLDEVHRESPAAEV